MRITIAGIGNAGSTVGADLSNKGHQVTLLKTSNKLHNEHYEKIKSDKVIKVNDFNNKYSTELFSVTDDVKSAISDAECIIIYIQTNYHEKLIKDIVQYMHDGQIVIIEPGYMATCYFIKYNCPDITIIEAESSPIDCRIVNPGEVNVLFKNVLNPFGVYPISHIEIAEKCLKSLGYPFEFTKNVVEAALHNPNLIVHTVGAIFSIPRIEYSNGNYWMYKEVFTPHIWNVVESLDKEKMDILEALGCERLPYVEACKKRNSTDKSENALDVFFDYAKNSSPSGPNVPDSRYITEDVPQGLVLLESLGHVLSIPTPTCSGLINCANAALTIDFRKNGRTVESLGYDNIMMILKENEKEGY